MPPSSALTSDPNKFLPALHHALSGSLGTLISTCTLYPLSLVVTRLQVQRQLRRERQRAGREARASDPGPAPPPPEYAGIADAFSQIWSSPGDGGPRAFYTGLAQDAAKSVLDSFLFFLFYEWFRAVRLAASRRRGRRKGRGLNFFDEMAVGMAAGACSRFFTTPIANIVTRKQTASLVPAGQQQQRRQQLSVRAIAAGIRRERGLAGFWSGYSASLVLTLNPSITFFLQEFLKGVVADERYDDPGPRLTFLLAASSKAVAGLLTYPFQTAKTRLQAGVPIEEPDADDDKEKENGKRDVDRAVERKLTTARAVRRFAQQSVFGVLAQVVRTEGVAALYHGVGADLLKGFFSHGTTMLAKDLVHKLLFKMYLLAVGVLAEIRNRRRLRRSAGKAENKSRPAVDYGIKLVANLIDGTQRAFEK
ncbi:mitochondrial carrier domain-containing protein [Xylariomycetidae sp. FL0641]|nr:mitochondrial carrier domain-containing protein [Xylariomycetidae sp. FL0641]